MASKAFLGTDSMACNGVGGFRLTKPFLLFLDEAKIGPNSIVLGTWLLQYPYSIVSYRNTFLPQSPGLSGMSKTRGFALRVNGHSIHENER